MKRNALQAGRLLILAALLGLFATADRAHEQSPKNAVQTPQASGKNPAVAELTGDLVMAKMRERNRLRESRLRQYSVPSTYQVRNDKGEMRAEARVVLRFRAPDTKEFTVVGESGSGLIRSRVFKPLMEVEVETAAGRNRYDSSITPENYAFTLLGEEDMDGAHCFVVEAIAKRAHKYLFNGKVWVHAEDFAIVRIAGRPAENPSFWLRRVDFVRRNQKLKEFWLPLKSESVTDVRLFGKHVLTIDYDRYEIMPANGTSP